MDLKQVKVAIGLIVQQGKILVGFRDHRLHQGGQYEFPGGKVETNETPQQAVIREVKEEVGIDVKVARLFHELVYEYSDRVVHLFFYTCFIDEASKIDSNWKWVAFDQLTTLKFPEANNIIINRLGWERKIAITPEFDQFKTKEIRGEIGACYIRMNAADTDKVIHILDQQNIDLQLIIQRDSFLNLPINLQQKVFAVHLNSTQLYEQLNLDQFKNINVIAACHHQKDIERANELGCDAIFLSPVKLTETHPNNEDILGWGRFSELSHDAKMPVYALGGIQLSDLTIAQLNAAYGIAGIGDFWLDS